MCMLMYSKYPHPSTLAPGGLQTTISTQSFNEFYTQLGKIFDYCKVMIATWDDLMDFFLEANPAYEQVGARDINLIQTGIWDDTDAYDAKYANCNMWGNRRWAKPGIIIDGKLVTTNLTDINMGFESSSTTRSTTRPARGRRASPPDPLGNPISPPYHPWNKETIRAPRPRTSRRSTPGTPLPAGTARRWRRAPTGACGPRPWPARPRTTPSSRPPATGCAWSSPATTSPRPRCSGRCPAPSTPWSATGLRPTPWASPPSSA